jgi:hypothetical protein
MTNRTFHFLAAFWLSILWATVGAAAQTSVQYYESSSPYEQCWSNNYNCRRDFAKTPSTSRVLIKNVSCYIEANTPLRLLSLGVADSTSSLFKKSVQIPATPNVIGSTYYYSINQPVYFLVGRDKYPAVSVNSANPGYSSVQCSIFGETVE